MATMVARQHIRPRKGSGSASQPAIRAREERGRMNARWQKKKGPRHREAGRPTTASRVSASAVTPRANDGGVAPAPEDRRGWGAEPQRGFACRQRREKPRHEEHAERGRDGPRQARHTVADERRGDQHRARG